MTQFLNFITRQEFLIAIIVIIFILIVFLITKKLIRDRNLKKIHSLEVDINSIRSTPLSIKINKAVGLSKVNTNVTDRVEKVCQDFTEVTQEFDQLTRLLGNAEDDVLTGHVGNGKKVIEETQQLFNTTQIRVLSLEKELDNLLEDETRLREDINRMKDSFRNVNQDYHQKMSYIPNSVEAIEEKISEVENEFNSFEEWMFASEYEKAQGDYNQIKEDVSFLEELLKVIVDLTTQTTNVLPRMMNETKQQYESVSTKGVYLGHLDVLTNLNVVNETLHEDEQKLKRLDVVDVDNHNQEAMTRLQQLSTLIDKEDRAFESVNVLKVSYFSQKEKITKELESLTQLVPTLIERFGFNDLNDHLPALNELNKQLNEKRDELSERLNSERLPFTSLLVELQELGAQINQLQNEIQQANIMIHDATIAEKRANEQVLKLQLLMNEVKSKIRQRNLPHISNTYEGDLSVAADKINQVNLILSQNPLNIGLLNSNLEDTIDFCFKLFNNVNNLVGTVDMVENAIVYANKYRSSSADLDSELTRAEVSFRNGEYTYALTVAIYAIENFKPGAKFEELIKENAKSA